jgi:hypothetical protein
VLDSIPASRDWPSAGITMSQAKSKWEFATGTAWRRPDASGSSNWVRTNFTPTTRPSPARISTGCASQWNRTPSTLEWSYSKEKAGISRSVRR